jgi:hypothetical protein
MHTSNEPGSTRVWNARWMCSSLVSNEMYHCLMLSSAPSNHSDMRSVGGACRSASASRDRNGGPRLMSRKRHSSSAIEPASF